MRTSVHLVIGITALAVVLVIVGIFEHTVLRIDKTAPIDVFIKCETLVFVLVLGAIAVTHALHWIESIRRRARRSQTSKPSVTWKELFQLAFLLSISALIIIGMILILEKHGIKSEYRSDHSAVMNNRG